MGVLQTIVFAIVFGALGVLLAVVLFIRIMRRLADDENETAEDEADISWITAAEKTRELVSRVSWLEFTQEENDPGTKISLPVMRIEYIAKEPNGHAYIGCYRIERKNSFFFAGYHTEESYEEIIRRLKCNEECEKK